MELQIYFKNVRQGDTIFLHWEDHAGEKKFGLIDCNTVNGSISGITDHIAHYKINAFEFVVLSHPHSDHFSGFLQLFDYCESMGITIDMFIHTSEFDPVRLQQLLKRDLGDADLYKVATAPVNRPSRKDELWNLFTRLAEQQEIKPNGFIKEVFVTANDYTLILNRAFALKFLSPFQSDEHDKYFTDTFEMAEDDKSLLLPENNPKSNLLSSLVRVATLDNSHQVLLTSDATKYTFKRLIERNHSVSKLLKAELLAAQIPHHGSIYNHAPKFWNAFPSLNNTHFVISVGDGYGHPSYDVVDYFHERGKAVHATNNVGGYHAFFEDGEADALGFYVSLMTLFDEDNGGASIKASGQDRCGEKMLRIIKSDNDVSCEVLTR